MKSLQINGVHITVLTDQESATYQAPITLKFSPTDNWGIASHLNRGNLFQLLTGRSHQDGDVDFGVPQDWAAAHPGALDWTVWDYSKNHAFGEPLDMRLLLPDFKAKLLTMIIEGSLPEDLED